MRFFVRRTRRFAPQQVTLHAPLGSMKIPLLGNIFVCRNREFIVPTNDKTSLFPVEHKKQIKNHKKP